MRESADVVIPTLDVEAIEPVLDETPVMLAVLYGSHARQEATAASDVDIAIAFEESCPSVDRTRARLALTERLRGVLGTDTVDVVPLGQASATLRREICEDGIVIYGPPATLDAYCEPVPETPTHEERLSEFDALLADLERVV